MAEYSIDIAQAHVELTGTEEPIALSANALDVIVSKYDGQYETTQSGSYVNSSEVGLPYIPPASLPAGSTWLIYYQASMGSSNSSGMVDCYLTDGTDPPRGHGWAECTGHGTPMMMNGSYMAGMFELVATGTDLLQFVFRSTTGVPVQVGGMQIVAIRTDEELTKSQASGDYWNAEQVGVFGTASATYQDMFSTTYTPSQSEDFWLVVSSEANIPLAEQVNMRVMVDGVQQLNQWIKESADNRDVHSFFFSHKISLSGGSAHTITVQVKKQTGANFVFVERTRVTMFRLESFSGNSYTQEYLPSSIAAVYPGWETVLQATHTPATSGEYVLAISNGLVFREQPAASLMRLINTTTGASMQEFASTAAPVPALSGLNESTVLTSGSAEAVSTPNTYQVQMSGESGYDTGPPQGYPSWRVSLMTLGLAKVVGPQNVFISGTELMSMSDFPQGDLESPISGTELMVMGDSGTLTTEAPPAEIPNVHPRLWLYNTPRLAYWQTRAAGLSDEYVAVRNYTGKTGRRCWAAVMCWLASGDNAFLTAALSEIDTILASSNRNAIIGSDGAGLYYREWALNMALCYDWIPHTTLGTTRVALMKDYLMAGLYMIWNNESAKAIWGTVSGNNFSTSSWAVTNPMQNYFSAHMMGSAYTILATHGELPTDFAYPPGSSTRYEFRIPLGTTTNPIQWYSSSELYQWLTDKTDNALPIWRENTIGGGWVEGSNYGRAAVRNQFELFLAFRQTAGVDYFTDPANTYLKEALLYELYASQPSTVRKLMVPYGDFGGDRRIPFHDFNRHLMLLGVEAYLGTAEARYGQYFVDNNTLPMNANAANTSEMIPYDFAYYKHDNPSEDYRAALPTSYFSEGNGMVNSRAGWSHLDASVTFTSADFVRNHQHEEQNGLLIYKAAVDNGWTNYWLLCDPIVFSGSSDGPMNHASNHNTYTVGVWGQRLSPGEGVDPTWDETGHIDRIDQKATYAYAQGNCNDAYWTKNSATSQHVSTPQVKMNDIFLREFFHIKSTGVVILYDRFRLLSAYSTEQVVAHWHYAGDVVNEGGGVYSVTAGTSKLYRKYMLPATGLSPSFADELAGTVVHETVTLPMTGTGIEGKSYGSMMTAFQVTTAASMTLMGPTPVTGYGTEATMEGATIQGASTTHILFSREENGATPSSILYYALRTGSSDQHYVTNLVPGQEYFITETAITGGYYRYTLAETFNIGFIANVAGVVAFQPGELAGQGTTPIRGTDATLSMTDSGSLTVGVLSNGTDATLGMIDSGQVIFNGVGEVVVSGQELMEPMADTGRFPGPAAGTELMGMADTGRLIYDPAPVPPPTWIEKKIFRGNVAFYPNENLGSTFFTYEPQDMTPDEILSDESDNTFIRTFPTLFGQRLILLSAVEVGLDDPAGFDGTIRSIRFVVRVRYANIAGTLNPVLVCALRHNGISLVQANVPIENVLTSDVVEVQSQPISVSITTDTVRTCSLRIQPRASAYSDNYQVELAAAWIETTGKANEKGISR